MSHIDATALILYYMYIVDAIIRSLVNFETHIAQILVTHEVVEY